MSRPATTLSRSAIAGFGLLEVIVALVLLSSTGLALFSWINQSLGAANRLRQIQNQAELSGDAQALIHDVNPVKQPLGRLEAGATQVEWTSSVVRPLTASSAAIAGFVGPWQIGLFRLKVTAKNTQSGAKIDFEQLQLGLQRVAVADSLGKSLK